jgi:hypothetical protein
MLTNFLERRAAQPSPLCFFISQKETQVSHPSRLSREGCYTMSLVRERLVKRAECIDFTERINSTPSHLLGKISLRALAA